MWIYSSKTKTWLFGDCMMPIFSKILYEHVIHMIEAHKGMKVICWNRIQLFHIFYHSNGGCRRDGLILETLNSTMYSLQDRFRKRMTNLLVSMQSIWQFASVSRWYHISSILASLLLCKKLIAFWCNVIYSVESVFFMACDWFVIQKACLLHSKS